MSFFCSRACIFVWKGSYSEVFPHIFTFSPPRQFPPRLLSFLSPYFPKNSLKYASFPGKLGHYFHLFPDFWAGYRSVINKRGNRFLYSCGKFWEKSGKKAKTRKKKGGLTIPCRKDLMNWIIVVFFPGEEGPPGKLIVPQNDRERRRCPGGYISWSFPARDTTQHTRLRPISYSSRDGQLDQTWSNLIRRGKKLHP